MLISSLFGNSIRGIVDFSSIVYCCSLESCVDLHYVACSLIVLYSASGKIDNAPHYSIEKWNKNLARNLSFMFIGLRINLYNVYKVRLNKKPDLERKERKDY